MKHYVEYFKFEKDPKVESRSIHKDMPKHKVDLIKQYPYIVGGNCKFEVKIIRDGKSYVFNGCIPKGFLYNKADIPFLLQLISYDKHSPYLKDASLIHDFLLYRKAYYYNQWGLEDLGFSVFDFRDITSEIFKLALIESSVPPKKAHAMAWCVNLWQKVLFLEWNKCKTPNSVVDFSARGL